MIDEARRRAYIVVLSAGLLHLKWDLACCLGGVSWWNPRAFLHQIRRVRIAAWRASALHNLAIEASRDFDHFDEEWFWEGVRSFETRCPDFIWGHYRSMFDRCLAGEEVVIIRPGG